MQTETTEVIEAVEEQRPEITTATGKVLPAELYADVFLFNAVRLDETITLNHTGGGCECDSWAGGGKLTGEIELCLDENGWQMFGGRIQHPIRFTDIGEDSHVYLMGATIVSRDEPPHAGLLVSVSE